MYLFRDVFPIFSEDPAPNKNLTVSGDTHTHTHQINWFAFRSPEPGSIHQVSLTCQTPALTSASCRSAAGWTHSAGSLRPGR